MKKTFFTICLVCIYTLINGQNISVIDSLKAELKKAKHDTTRCKLLSKIVEGEFYAGNPSCNTYNDQIKNISLYHLKQSALSNSFRIIYLEIFADYLNNKVTILLSQGNTKEAFKYCKKCLKIGTGINNKKITTNALFSMASIYYQEGSIDNAINSMLKIIDDLEKMNEPKTLALAYSNIAFFYNEKSNYKAELEFLLKSLRLNEKIKDKNGLSQALNNLASLYDNWGMKEEALHYYKKSLGLAEEMGNKSYIANCLGNLAGILDEKGKYKEAKELYFKSLSIHEYMKNKEKVQIAISNIGTNFCRQGDTLSALTYLNKSLKIARELNNKNAQCADLHLIGFIALSQGNNKEALQYLTMAYELAKELNNQTLIKKTSFVLYKIYKKTGNIHKSLTMYEQFIQIRDSISKLENKKAIIQSQYKYEYEKKAIADSIKTEKSKSESKLELEKKHVQLKQEKTQRYALYGGVLLLGVFGWLMFKRFKNEQKQKQLIEEQKHIIDEKNQAISESIDYALHIQGSVLPHFNVENLVPDSFLLYNPKDVVSGDFYWFEESNDNVYFTVADCTGHGVPGAFMSLLGTSLLNEIYNKHPHDQACDFLNKLNTLVKYTFKQHLVPDKHINDGMDIAFCILNKKTLELQYAGANRPLWLLKKGENTISEIKANKQAIGGTNVLDYQYTNHTFQLQKGDSVYLTSDGYADQFGGDKGKKMMTKVLKQKLEEIGQLPMMEQYKELLNFYNTWKGTYEQVDDVCVMGIRA